MVTTCFYFFSIHYPVSSNLFQLLSCSGRCWQTPVPVLIDPAWKWTHSHHAGHKHLSAEFVCVFMFHALSWWWVEKARWPFLDQNVDHLKICGSCWYSVQIFCFVNQHLEKFSELDLHILHPACERAPAHFFVCLFWLVTRLPKGCLLYWLIVG